MRSYIVGYTYIRMKQSWPKIYIIYIRTCGVFTVRTFYYFFSFLFIFLLFFSRCLRAFLTDLQKRLNPHPLKLKLSLLPTLSISEDNFINKPCLVQDEPIRRTMTGKHCCGDKKKWYGGYHGRPKKWSGARRTCRTGDDGLV